MTVVRMWETRLEPAGIGAFWSAVGSTWDEMTACDGFVSGEAFESAAGEPRAVIITRWRDAAAAGAAAGWEAALDALSARPGFGWFFDSVPLPEALGNADGR